MCDTLAVTGGGRTLFAKNSDRHLHEPQVVEMHPPRDPGDALRTQYLTIPDAGACRVVGSRPAWLWGFEHGINEFGVVIGNERVFTRADAAPPPDALIGMDLVRLGLERGRNATEAVEIMTGLIERHGQGGGCAEDVDERYSSSFLVVDARDGWVLETSGTTWAARPIGAGDAISNRLTIGTDWTRASADVEPGVDFQEWRDAAVPTELADLRLDVTRPCVARGAGALTPRDLASVLRDHGGRAWGAPGDDTAPTPPLTRLADDWRGFTVCIHLRDVTVTAAGMVAEIPQDPRRPRRAWVALGNPCASVFVPIFPTVGVPPELGRVETWGRFAALRDRVDADPDGDTLGSIRAVLAPVEEDLWGRADAITSASERPAMEAFTEAAWAPVDDALRSLGV